MVAPGVSAPEGILRATQPFLDHLLLPFTAPADHSGVPCISKWSWKAGLRAQPQRTSGEGAGTPPGPRALMASRSLSSSVRTLLWLPWPLQPQASLPLVLDFRPFLRAHCKAQLPHLGNGDQDSNLPGLMWVWNHTRYLTRSKHMAGAQ